MIVISTLSLLQISTASERISAQSPRLVRDEHFTHSVVLGDKIDASITIETDRRITEVRASYTPSGRQLVSSYDYADFRQDGSSLNANITIKTKSPTYIPPGTIFDVRFEFTDDTGERHLSDIYSIEYLDTERNWQRVYGSELEIIYYGISRNAISRLHSSASSPLADIKEALGVEDSSPMRAVIFPNVRQLTRYGPSISQAATDGIFFGGYAYPHYNLTIMASPSAEVLVHELTHILFDKAFTSPLSTSAPAWLNEGIATYFENPSKRALESRLSPYLRNDDLNSFRKLNTVPGRRRDISAFYAQSGDFVGFLVERAGTHSLGHLIANLDNGDSIDTAMRSVYGYDLRQLENEWRRSYGLPTLSAPEIAVDVDQRFPPTIPGLPTLVSEPRENEEAMLATQATTLLERQSEPSVVQASASPTPQMQSQPLATATATSIEATAVAEERGYLTGQTADEWPQPNPTMVLVFALIALGAGALLWRRMRQ